MVYKKPSDYFQHIVGLISTAKSLEYVWYPVDFSPHKNNNLAGTIGTDDSRPLIFKKDGAKLAFIEEFEIINGVFSRRRYSIKYSNDKLTFRYDKDPKESYPEHALYHIHINEQDKPRLITHETSFEEILDFVNATYYDERSQDGRKTRS